MIPDPEIAAAVTAFCAAWSARDPAALLALWDRDDAAAIYLPAGNAAPLVGAPAIEGYIRAGCGMARVLMRAEAVHARQLAADLGLAYFPLAWAMQDKPARKAIGGRVRATMLLRRSGGAWRIFHYAEAPLAPLLTLQAFYEAVAADGLEAIPIRSAP